VRETIAGARFLNEAGKGITTEEMEEIWPNFDPYEARWDINDHEPLTLVRNRIDRILSSLTVEPEVLRTPPFSL